MSRDDKGVTLGRSSVQMKGRPMENFGEGNLVPNLIGYIKRFDILFL